MSVPNEIKRIQALMPKVMLRDRETFSKRLKKIRSGRRRGESDKRPLYQLRTLEKKIEASIREREERLAHRPAISYPKTFPIAAKREEIIQAIKENQVVIISGETGSGKSTQIPKMCLEAGRGIAGMIGCTQPRRIAATTIGRRIAEEMGEDIGQTVGYKIRFREKIGRGAYFKIMTDGILLAETQQDPHLYEYDTLIIDEAHERSLNIDFLLGILKTLIQMRPELKIVITSATLDTKKFSDAFDNAPVIEVEGRVYRVDVKYSPLDSELEAVGEVTYVEMAVKVVDTLWREKTSGDILVFMPTEQDIRETCERLEGRNLSGVTVLPLFARLPAAQQGRIYSVTGRKVVVATNVAETSLTIPGIKYVIDTGLARISRYLPGSRTTSLPISPISQSSADQRKGRCGRVKNGICIRLYSKEDYESRSPFSIPEILRSNLAEVILRMISMKMGQISSFPFLDRPSTRSIKDGFDLLLELGAIVRKGRTYALTEKGHIMARMPLDPKISRMIIEARKEGCVKEVAIIASALSIQDPRERPAEKASQADQMHAPFKDPNSDFITLLNIWNRYHNTWARLKTQRKMRKFCREHFLSFPRMREWVHIHGQISNILREQKISQGSRGRREITEPLYDGIHKSILSGYLSNIAIKKDKNIYRAARGREAMIFPGSAIFNKGYPWIVGAEMVKTSRLFARTTAKIDPQWLEALGGDLCKSSYADPHWEKNRGEVMAFEQVTLYGLPVVSRRSVSYGSISPDEAHDIFVRSALVEGEVKERLSFLQHNRNLIKKIGGFEDKLRRRGILAGEEVVAEFYSRQLKGIRDIRSLKHLIREKGNDHFLKISEEDLLFSQPDEQELAFYPDEMVIGETPLKTSYKFAPGKEEDGVTVSVPFSLIARFPAERLEWGVPGLFREKVTALIKGLPKRYRKKLVPVSGTVTVIANEMEREDQSLITALARFIYRRFGVDIPASVWQTVDVPDHLKMRISVTDQEGREVKAGRDLSLLGRPDVPSSGEHEKAVWNEAQAEWERTGITSWDFDSLPESIPLGPHLIAHPGLESTGDSVNIRLFQTLEAASESHKKGVQSLACLHLSKDLKFLRRNLTLPKKGVDGILYFGGERHVEEALYQHVVKALFYRDFRERELFYDHIKNVEGTILSRGKAVKDEAIRVLQAYHDTRMVLRNIENANKTNREVLTLCGRVRENLDTLVPQDFLEHYAMDRLTQIPRYLKGLEIRAERGTNDPEKDKKKSTETEVFIQSLQSMMEELSPYASRRKREAIEDYRWMVEEYKISLFAQELKTQFPISKKRLEKKRAEIERMV
jgi:ATP-dependent helicase HrpA